MEPPRALVFAAALIVGTACASAPPPTTTTTEIDLPKPGHAAPAWPVGLTPCPKDAPEGSSCAVARPTGSAAAPASSATPMMASADTVWHVPVGPDDPSKGPADALVTLVVFSDFECPFCKRILPTLERVLSELPNDVRIVWKDLPLPAHPYAENAAELARVARAKGGDVAFWKAHALLYEAQESLGEPAFKRIAATLGLPWAPTWAAIREARFGTQIQADVALSDRVDVQATPTTFVNGIKLVGAQPYDRTRALVDAELAKARHLADTGTARGSVYASIMANGVQVAPPKDTPTP
jgi:protein-disulfide isomerase